MILEDLLFDNDGDYICLDEVDDIGSLLDCEDDSTIEYLLENTEADTTAQVDRETKNLFREMFQAPPRRKLQ